MDPELERVFSALAEPSRRHVLRLLSDRQRPAGELAQALGMSPAAMSRHLRVLLAAGLVSDARGPEDARLRIFSLKPEGLATAERWLSEVEQQWRVQLESYRRHVEATRPVGWPRAPGEGSDEARDSREVTG